jgi:hypothetical protein
MHPGARPTLRLAALSLLLIAACSRGGASPASLVPREPLDTGSGGGVAVLELPVVKLPAPELAVIMTAEGGGGGGGGGGGTGAGGMHAVRYPPPPGLLAAGGAGGAPAEPASGGAGAGGDDGARVYTGNIRGLSLPPSGP